MAGKNDGYLSSVERHVAEALRSIERQRRYIDVLIAQGSNIEDAERTLKAIIQTLSTLEAYLRFLSRSLSKSVQ
jgi:prefoldin subunit 5